MTCTLPRTAEELATCLSEARARTLALVDDLDDSQLLVPCTAIVNPILWEIGHVAWFHERWLLRHLGGDEPLIANGDALYDSTAVLHDSRWHLALPDRKGTYTYMQEVARRVQERLASAALGAEALELHRLTLFHEDMHCEALTYTRQTLGYPRPALVECAEVPSSPARSGDAVFEGGTLTMGAARDAEFVFDNEQWAHPVEVAPFRLARVPVTETEYAAFVDESGYLRSECWTPEGWAWRQHAGAQAPVYWRRDGDSWTRRVFDRWVPLRDDLPLIHVNAFEAEAYCAWSGRRLPTEAEWEFAAGPALHPWGDEPADEERAGLDLARPGCVSVHSCAAGETTAGVRHLEGNVWEWSADTFGPYPGFAPKHYREYSAPWFTGHRTLRGGAYATRARMLRNTCRNFYTPDRRDVLAGFRTAADAER